MDQKKLFEQKTSRRTFLKQSAMGLAMASFLPSALTSCASDSAAPAANSTGINSNFNGVKIGCITYSWRSMPANTVDELIAYCKQANLGSLELMSNDLERVLGVPESPQQRIMAEARAKMPAPKPGERPGRPQLTPEQQAEIAKYNEELKAWRVNMDMSKVEAVRKQLNDAGIEVHIVKFSPSNWSDEEIEYACKATKAMGAKAITEEISVDAAKRMAPFVEKHGLYMAFHNHMQYAEEGFSCDPVLAVSPNMMLNFDCGHYFGSTGKNPVDFINKYHDRIYSIHLKDKTGKNTEPANTNQVWGQGETPLKEVLNLLKDNKWPIYCDIELEYEIKPWSNAVKELGVCVRHARELLM
ncbi:MAG: sugar phosphate isomerase/epimerase [Alistipes sp.]|nr:sugar phosphate isomerase/epimerase [Alistipes sp.]MBR7114651.1 sugar phosphate isomerase/epimerase [Alistipes sp.]MDO5488251.1 sugar phosphate isomerase/epimerase [Rikenellaceae bacterium]